MTQTWLETTMQARERGFFTYIDKVLAGHYMTCAVGEQRRLAGLADTTGLDYVSAVDYAHRMSAPLAPADEECDGMRFFRAVQENQFDEAEDLLGRIADRALELKRWSHTEERP